MINQRLNSPDEPHRMWQLRVQVEGSFVRPARMNIKKPGIADRAKSIDAQAAGFRARRDNNLMQRPGNRTFLALARMKTRKDK